jgi:retron-type reverse transcriptase
MVDWDMARPRTDKLMEEVLRRENLFKALKRVQKNKGASGVDGMTVIELPAYLKNEWPRIRKELLEATYVPLYGYNGVQSPVETSIGVDK